MSKKIFLLAVILLTIFFTGGCGSNSGGDEKSEPKVGTLTQLNPSSQGEAINFYENFNSMQMALQSQNIDKIQTYQSVADYMTANNSEFAIENSATVPLVDNFCCAMRADDVDLKNSFDAAIGDMKTDGTLDKLIGTFIKKFSTMPTAVELPHFDDTETIRVGITGDLPPLDLVLADGTPAGFNTAVLSEIGKRLHKNIELIQIDSGARAAALTSGQVDVIFWVVVPQDDSRPKNFDTPDGVSVTTPYYQDTVVNVNLSNLGAGF